jgi:hypothetical protein
VNTSIVTALTDEKEDKALTVWSHLFQPLWYAAWRALLSFPLSFKKGNGS